MKDIFDFNRFGKLFVYECVNYLPRYIKGIVVAASVLVALWLLSLDGESFLDDGRGGMVCMLFLFAISFSPFFVYKDINDRKKGVLYAMIPASTLEKLLSMIIITLLVVPVIVYVALTATDFVLFALSSMGIGDFTNFDFGNPFTFITSRNDSVYSVLTGVVGILASIMFNTVFRKNKIIKTILFHIAVTFLISFFTIMFVDVFRLDNFVNLMSWVDDNFNVVFYITQLLSTTAIVVITYYRLKRVNY